MESIIGKQVVINPEESGADKAHFTGVVIAEIDDDLFQVQITAEPKPNIFDRAEIQEVR